MVKEKQIVKNRNKWLNDYVLSEEDFYPPTDDRKIQTYIEEMYDGDFDEYAEYIYDLYESEDYWEN